MINEVKISYVCFDCIARYYNRLLGIMTDTVELWKVLSSKHFIDGTIKIDIVFIQLHNFNEPSSLTAGDNVRLKSMSA